MDGWKSSFLLGRPIFRGYVKKLRESYDLATSKRIPHPTQHAWRHPSNSWVPSTLGWPDGPGHDQETGSFFNGTKPRRPATRWIEKSIDWSFFRRCFESIFFWQKICQVWSGPWEVIASGKPYLFPKRFSQCLSRIWLSPCHNTCSTYAVVNKHINGN